MRIISGIKKGKKLFSPIGENTRPTSDKARGAIFNMLENAPWSSGVIGKNIIDCFAGSGAFGLESLSRGANFAVFIENDRLAKCIIQKNIIALCCEKNSKIEFCDALKIKTPPNNFKADIVFFDPPYFKELGLAAFLWLKEKNWIGENAIVIFEHHKNESPPQSEFLEFIKTTNHGIGGVSIYKYL